MNAAQSKPRTASISVLHFPRPTPNTAQSATLTTSFPSPHLASSELPTPLHALFQSFLLYTQE